MSDKTVSRYAVVLTAGPGEAMAQVAVAFHNEAEEFLGEAGESWFAFGVTWKDVARFVRDSALNLGLDIPPAGSVSPHLDLT